MGIGKWIVGGVVAAVTAPFVLPVATVAAVATGAATVAGAVATGTTIATGVATVGCALNAAYDKGHDDGLTEGEKNGYAKASREYEEKFKSLCSQLNKANITISEQRQCIAELRDLNTKMRDALEYYKAKGENVSSLRSTYDTSNIILKSLAA